jgi:hypothetical protein
MGLLIENVTNMDGDSVHGYRSDRAYGLYWSNRKYGTYGLYPSCSRLRNRVYSS